MSETEHPAVARDARHSAIEDVLREPILDAFGANIGDQARKFVAVEDVNALIDSVVEALDSAGLSLVSREAVARHLLTHVGGDEKDSWQAGHNYAMREAARLVREGWERLTPADGTTSERSEA